VEQSANGQAPQGVPVKWVVSLFIVGVLAGTWSLGNYMGTKSERTAQELRTAQALLRQATEAERIREHDLRLAFEARDRETRIIREVREIRVDVPAADCRALGADWVREYNRALAVGSDSGGRADAVR
jgi:hypothetical protein